MDATQEMIDEGRALYTVNCRSCHGSNAVAAALPDLRYATAEVHEQFPAIVAGSRADLGMPGFADRLDTNQIQSIQAYVLARAEESQARAAQ